jgi:guanine nucleotide-binding protein subunit alpha
MAHHDDPLAVFTAPPPGETDQDRIAREAKEAEAKQVSDLIDEDLKREKAALKKQALVKVLLLGQSESGKSTILKNFRLKYAVKAWRAERTAWRAVIQLNLIRSVVIILEAIQAEMNGTPIVNEEEDDIEGDELSNPAPIKFTDIHQLLKLRLTPLRRVETDLKRRVGAESDEADPPSAPMYATPFDAVSSRPSSSRKRPGEFVVRSWIHVLERMQERGRRRGAESPDSDDATGVIAGCRQDIKALWADPIVHDLLAKRKIRLADSADFFLGEVDRIATRTYDPSDDDIVRARLRTVGVQEHRLKFEGGPVTGGEWAIYDVGGSRTSRAAWLPYFDDVTAIIFLAPISCFDEQLAEDHSINRLEDTFILWRSICSSKLLAKASLILFLNKCDLLEKKIKRGTIIKKHLSSYGDRPNEAAVLIKYLRQKFKDTALECSDPKSKDPNVKRVIYPFATSAINTKTTALAIQSVREGILQEHLRGSNLT